MHIAGAERGALRELALILFALQGSMRNFVNYWLGDVDDLLRGERTLPGTLAERGLEVRVGRLLAVIVAMSVIYGVCMGSFALLKETPPELGSDRGRYMQVVASAVKTPALFFLTLIVTLPSLYVFNALVGSRLRLPSVINLLVASLAVNTTVLASLGPIVAFFSLSTTSHPFVVLMNVASFAVAGVLGLLFLLQTLHRLTNVERLQQSLETASSGQPNVAPGEPTDTLPKSDADQPTSLSGQSPGPASLGEAMELQPRKPAAIDLPEGDVLARHTRIVFRCWVVLFALVGAQMGWVLRPFIGSPSLPFEWFRPRDSNFFAAILSALSKLLGGD